MQTKYSHDSEKSKKSSLVNPYKLLKSKRIVPLLFFLLLAGQLFGQRHVKDSLQSLLKTQLDARTQVDILNELAYQYYDFEDSIALTYARKGLALAIQHNYKKGIKYSYTLVGLGYSSQSMYREAITNYRFSDGIIVSNAQTNSSYNKLLLGNVYRDIAKYDSALIYYHQAKREILKGDLSNLSNIYKNIASIHLILWRNQDAIKYLDSATKALEKVPVSVPYVEIDMMSLYGQAYQNLLQFDKSKEYFDRMCNEAIELDDYHHQITCKLNQAHLAYNKGNFTQALAFCFEALKLSNKYKFPPQFVKLLVEIGQVYSNLSQYDVASKYLFQALRLSEQAGLYFETAQIYRELAWINKNYGNYDVALEYADKSQSISERIGDRKGVAGSCNVRGLIFFLQEEYEKSIGQHEIALKIRKSLDHTEGISASIYNLSLVYERLNQFEKALDMLLKVIAIEEKIDNKFDLGISYHQISALLIKQSRLNEALIYLEKAMLLGQETKSLLLQRNAAESFTTYYETTKEYDKALRYQKIYKLLNDSIFINTGAIKLTELEALYTVEKNEREISKLETDRAQREKVIEAQNKAKTFLVWMIVLSLIIVVLMLRLYFLKQRSNQKLHDLNATKDKLFSIIGHDLKGPLNSLTAFSSLLLNHGDNLSKDEIKILSTDLDKSIRNLLVLLENLLEWSSSQKGNIDFKKEAFDIAEMLKENMELLSGQAQNKKIRIVTESKPNLMVEAHRHSINTVIRNLLSNAIKFTPEGGTVTMKVEEGEYFVVSVTDTGVGMTSETIQKLFKIGSKHSTLGTSKEKGTGLGLILCKDFVEKNGGTINVESLDGKGSCFSFSIPGKVT